VGSIEGCTDGNAVGINVGLRLGEVVGPHVSKFVTVILASVPKSTQCPSQFANIICCQSELCGTPAESVVSSDAKIVPLAHASTHL